MDTAVMRMRGTISTRAYINLLLALIGVGVALLILEIGLRLTRDSPETDIPLHVTCGDCPYLYELNPDHPDVRDLLERQNHSPERLQSTFNVMVLGDSVAYGVGVPFEDAFPQRLEDLLVPQYDDVAVLNSAVSGYTPYNQLQQYVSRDRDIPVDVVIVAFAMNDIVDPELHWNYTEEAIENIPIEAYPNLRYHEQHVVPILETRRQQREQKSTELDRLVRSTVNVTNITDREASYTMVDGHRWPTYITGEDTISIEVLTDYDSPEWVWLRGMYDRLADEVRKDGARLVIVVLPVAYQMDAEYPFLPQSQFARYCEERSLMCLDLLPAFRERGGETLFLGERLGYIDIWHLSERGHDVAATELRAFLERHNLIGRR
ncbi:MAG: SGNH/GDSL hydrolase family protein [Chloroflexota bacterium]|nr:SGNH/GDSL hydrolase family protein [Chloroflexota bacterium]